MICKGMYLLSDGVLVPPVRLKPPGNGEYVSMLRKLSTFGFSNKLVWAEKSLTIKMD